jgi:hypothetical protein
MTDLRDQIVAALKRTTITYPEWVKQGKPKGSNWTKAFDLLAQLEPTRANPVPPPKSGCYLGAYIEGSSTYGYYFPKLAPWSNAPMVDKGHSDAWAQFEKSAGKPVKLLMFGAGGPNPWAQPFAAQQVYLDLVIDRYAIPVLDVSTGSTPLTDFTLGKHDAAITAWAKDAAAWGKPFVLRLDAEMNGTWYDFGAQARKSPTAFTAAWRSIRDLFDAAGATNVSWHWCPNVDPENTQTPLEQLYPGDAYVDWAGMTGYNEGGETCSGLFDSTYARLVKLAPSKPIMVGEVGSVDAGFPGQKVAFISDFFADLLSKYAQVRGFCWFNWRTAEHDPPWDWPIESSPESLKVFRVAVASPKVVGR